MPRVHDPNPRTLPPRKYTSTPIIVTVEVRKGWANKCEECDLPFKSKLEGARYCSQVCGERFRNKVRPRNR